MFLRVLVGVKRNVLWLFVDSIGMGFGWVVFWERIYLMVMKTWPLGEVHYTVRAVRNLGHFT